jgi:dihydrofolate reductase
MSEKQATRMRIRARMSMSADGYVTTPGGWPAVTADPAFASGGSHGIREFLAGCEAALMGRVTFEPALGSPRWPWPGLDVFVLGSRRPAGTPDDVVVESDAARLLARMRAVNRGGDVHLVGGPRTIQTFLALGALDELHLVVLPLLLGDGMRLTPALSPDTGLTFLRQRALGGGSVEIVYSVRPAAAPDAACSEGCGPAPLRRD